MMSGKKWDFSHSDQISTLDLCSPGNIEQLWSLAILAGPNEKLDAAKYFENSDKPQFDKAVILYEKAGYVGKAMELAFDKKQHNEIGRAHV